jgi:hypothetical protein
LKYKNKLLIVPFKCYCKTLNKKINEFVYQLYGLTEEETCLPANRERLEEIALLNKYLEIINTNSPFKFSFSTWLKMLPAFPR